MAYLKQEEYDFIFNRVPRLCVDMVIRNEKGGILLTRRTSSRTKICGICLGNGQNRETIADAANRVAQKEFGATVEVIKNLGACETMIDDLGPDKPRHSVSVVLEVRITSGTPQITSESSEVGYFTGLPRKVHPYHKVFIQETAFSDRNKGNLETPLLNKDGVFDLNDQDKKPVNYP